MSATAVEEVKPLDQAVIACLSPEEAAELAALRARQLELMQFYPSARYVPCGKISEWIDMVGEHPLGTGRVVTYLLSGANGVGKTRALSEMGAALLRGAQGEWLDRPLFRDFPRPCRIRLVSTQTALEEGALRELHALLKPELADGYPKKGGTTRFSEWVCASWSVCPCSRTWSSATSTSTTTPCRCCRVCHRCSGSR